jgi:hypothetical protein
MLLIIWNLTGILFLVNIKSERLKHNYQTRLSRLQVGIVSSYFGFKALMDPTKGDMVAALCDSLGENAGKIMHRVYIHQIYFIYIQNLNIKIIYRKCKKVFLEESFLKTNH